MPGRATSAGRTVYVPTVRDRGEREEFILTHTAALDVPFVPGVRLQLATSEVTSLWLATETWLHERNVPMPFWAFAWAGGQALARYLYDTKAEVRGKRVLDFASGSGLVAIAAAHAGALSVSAVDIDPFAATACALNAEANGVTLDIVSQDLVGGRLPRVDVVTAGDIWYEAGPADRFATWLRRIAADGVRVLTADPGRAYVPTEGVRELARYDVPTPVELEGSPFRTTRVLEVLPPA
jgi:predicted nicotinamide N-methyase